jgi:hypothetical protein
LAFILGAVNHYSTGFVILVYLLYNYSLLFKNDTILYYTALSVILIGYFAVMRALLPDLLNEKDDGFAVWDIAKAIQAFIDYNKYQIMRDMLLT